MRWLIDDFKEVTCTIETEVSYELDPEPGHSDRHHNELSIQYANLQYENPNINNMHSHKMLFSHYPNCIGRSLGA